MIVRKSSEIYLDSNATTAVLPAAARAAREAMEEVYGNPSSSHVSGLKARDILETARRLCREVLGANDGQIVFTSGATEAIQMGVFSTLVHIREQRLKQSSDQPAEPRLLLFGATEHKAVPQAIKHWNHLLGINNQVVEIPVDGAGQLDLDFIRKHAPRADLICTMAVNNETGVVTPLDKVEAAIREINQDVMWLVDCVQAIGKLKMNLSASTIDYATISGHKIYAPKGIGVLYVREGTTMVPMMAGGGQEQGARGGTENLPGVAAIAAVFHELVNSPTCTFADEDQLHRNQQRIISSLKRAFPSVVFNNPPDAVATTINFAVKGFANKELLDLFDAAGIRVSSGSACGSAVVGSYVLDAMGLPRWRSEGAIRMSFGPLTTESEINAACERIEDAGRALCDSCLVLSDDSNTITSEPVDGLVQLKNGSDCTWLLMDKATSNCVVIDPFESLAGRAESLIRCQKSNVLAILDSHAHVDHDSCRGELLESVSDFADPMAHTSDELGWPETSAGTVKLDDDSEVPFIKFSKNRIVAQVSLPGHTKIGRAYFVGEKTEDDRLPADAIEFAFLGDMILMGGIGRTDFPCSSIEEMYSSLQRLPKLISSETILCPTHDYNNEFATTFECERNGNTFLSSIVCGQSPISLDSFLELKPTVDAGIADVANSELVCGLIKESSGTCPSALEVPRGQLKEFFAEHRDSRIIDVREPHEFSFAQDWSEFGLENPPENVPLTRLSGFLPELLRSLRSQDASQDIIFLCRSGRRSGVAAAVAQRIGIKSAKHISGGIALNVATKCVAEEWAEPGYMI